MKPYVYGMRIYLKDGYKPMADLALGDGGKPNGNIVTIEWDDNDEREKYTINSFTFIWDERKMVQNNTFEEYVKRTLITEIDLKEIGLPEDVIKNSWLSKIPLYGKLKNDPNEIIVITQYKREVFIAWVCHLSKGYKWRNGKEECPVILDMPGFNKIRCCNPHTIKEINGIRYTMACISEKMDYPVSNWLS